MTINDLIADSIVIQGRVRVSSFDEEGTETVHYECDDTNDDLASDMDLQTLPCADKDITYLFAIDNVLHIEVSGE